MREQGSKVGWEARKGVVATLEAVNEDEQKRLFFHPVFLG
jgi:hypothetical protein